MKKKVVAKEFSANKKVHVSGGLRSKKEQKTLLEKVPAANEKRTG